MPEEPAEGDALGEEPRPPLRVTVPSGADERPVRSSAACADGPSPKEEWGGPVQRERWSDDVDEAVMAAACDSFLMATDVADALVAADVPFREAHDQAGTLVRRCLDLGVPLDGLCAEEVEGRWPHLAGLLHDLVDTKRSLATKTSSGGSAPARVREQLALARERLA